jgi:quinol monooxygenase YgiN
MKRAPSFVYKTVAVEVRPHALEKVVCGLEQVTAHAYRCEPGTRLCAWFQAKEDPTRFLQVLVFDDDEAERVHRGSLPARHLAKLLSNGSAHANQPTEWNVLAGI